MTDNSEKTVCDLVVRDTNARMEVRRILLAAGVENIQTQSELMLRAEFDSAAQLIDAMKDCEAADTTLVSFINFVSESPSLTVVEAMELERRKKLH